MSSEMIPDKFLYYIVNCIDKAVDTMWINDFIFYASFPCSVKAMIDIIDKFAKEEVYTFKVLHVLKKDNKIMFVGDNDFHVIMTILHMRRNKYILYVKVGTELKTALERF
jgi:hypothetical protein